ncbi:MAG TPA: tyrosine-type recombinase/integrase [Phenylobacterium sp.]|jgi:integrase
MPQVKDQGPPVHDLRHEAASRLFEAKFTIEQVALVTGHKDWKMLKRYTNLRPEQLHKLKAAPVVTPPEAQSAKAVRQSAFITVRVSSQWRL